MKNYLIFMCSMLMLAACGDKNHTENTAASGAAITTVAASATQNADWPTYTVGSELSYPPFQFMKDSQGGVDGFEMELLQAIAKAEKFNVNIINTPRNTAMQTLNSGERDIWASAFSINPETEANAELSKPFLDFEFTIYVLDNDANKGLVSPASFKGKKLSVSQFSKYATDAATRLTESPKNVIASPTLYLALKEVYLKQADGVLSDSRVLAYHKLKNPEIKTRSIPLGDPPKHLVFLVKKGRTDLIEKLNSGLDKVKADGTYTQLVKKWFGENVQ